MKKVLTIAGSDSGGGAGIQQDLKVFNSFGAFGMSVVTAVTAQNTLGVRGYSVLPLGNISGQIDAVFEDVFPDAVKTGMLADSHVIDLVHGRLRRHKAKNLVVDPVMVSTSGHRLLDEDAVESLRKLFSISAVVTPNINEAEMLSGMKIKCTADMEEAAEEIGSGTVVKGGHLEGVDVLFYGGRIHRFRAERKVDARLHGAGCAFSAAVAASLADGESVVSAVGKAKRYVNEAIGRRFRPGKGSYLLDTGGINKKK